MNQENTKERNPDLGLTFERKDRYFTHAEQRVVERFMISQIPTSTTEKIDFSKWKDGKRKIDTRIFFQLILKSQSFPYLKAISPEELKTKLIKYVKEKSKIKIIEKNKFDTRLEKLKRFFSFNKLIKEVEIAILADSLSKILTINDSDLMLKKIIALNQYGIFDDLGVGFLISLLPQEKLADLIYLKLEMFGKNIEPIKAEFGTLNYPALYKELLQTQKRLSNRNYDLRLSEEDRNEKDLEIEAAPDTHNNEKALD